MPKPVTLGIDAVEATDRRGRATVRGQVWLGPVAVGDRFTAASRWDHEDPVNLTLEAITAPPDAQEVGRTARVIAVLTGDGIDRVQSGTVLLGETRNATPFHKPGADHGTG